MPKPFRLMVLTPEREFYNDEAYSVTVNTIAGHVGVLADHIPMVTALTVGELTIRVGDEVKTAFHSEGFMEVRTDGVIILCQACEWPEEIDIRRAERDREAAEELLRQKRSMQEYVMAKSMLARAMVRLQVKGRRGVNN